MVRWLLVHPPLLGPAVLEPLADVLRGRGDTVAVPDLRAAVEVPGHWWDDVVAESLTAVPDGVDAVLGFSGAGVVLPLVAAAVGGTRAVWVDALVPAVGATFPSPAMRSMLDSLTRDGRIAPWPTWWGPDAMADMFPDADLRDRISAQAPSLPAEFYDHAVPAPERWPQDDVTYVHLSSSYDDHAERARERGWTVVGDGAGLHTDLATEPEQVADLIG